MAGLLLLAACGSSGSGTTAASGSPSDSSAQVAAAQALVKQYTARPTKLNVDPLPAAPKPGGTIVYTNSGGSSAGVQYTSLKEAAGLVGWNVVSVPYDPTNQPSLNGALDSALTLNPKPVAVVLVSVPQTIWQNQIAKYNAAGIGIIAYGTPGTTADAVKGTIKSDFDSVLWGKMMANWVIADSNGKGKALVVTWPDNPSFKSISDSATANFKSGCSTCSTTTLNLPLSTYTVGANDAIVSALQSHPDYKYVVSAFGSPILGLDAAMKAAGISGVKVSGANPAPANFQGLADGAASAGTWVAGGYAVVGYMMLDEALRIQAGLPIKDGDGGIPTMLLTKDNVGTGTVTDAVQEVPDNYKALFGATWHAAGY